ncbi:substrate-binding periplasmic protein [Thiorhodovibrio frisius]|uniref:Periplasmic component of amino acid ABC-type transporter/signal transduction system n=1 Tax=Thiorhodovibrio frisius TaxID=631362 RepID=H8Z678_9GAMM|nr:ABC transporter substrate-binding protein [Thiorhodovibrio frisius]EIC19645.1 periplasmic component of amino acid ABC-type transporter/signal transduction system [Thiorhodovibrio frisius]WPL20388.1 Cyclohexadienyl dehydratase precursor [Thiorhodovibrio frisius]
MMGPRAWLVAGLMLGLSQGMAQNTDQSTGQSINGEPNRLERILSAGQVRVCIWPEYYGITYRDPRTQSLSGIDYDMAQALAADLGVELELIESSFAELIPDIEQDRCDVAMFAIGITPEREKHLRFTEPHLASDIYAVTTKANRRINSWEDIDRDGVLVAVAKGTLHEPIMRRRLQQARLKVFDTPFAREQEVRSGRADVFMTDYPYGKRMLDTVDWARLIAPEGGFHITPYAYALKPGDDAWHARMQEFVQSIKQDGRLAVAAEKNGLSLLLVGDVDDQDSDERSFVTIDPPND